MGPTAARRREAARAAIPSVRWPALAAPGPAARRSCLRPRSRTPSTRAGAATYYVRQTSRRRRQRRADAGDGVEALLQALRGDGRGDTAFVGPGLYREQVDVEHDGTADERIVFIADTTGQQTGDPPGRRHGDAAPSPSTRGSSRRRARPGVYSAPFPAWKVWGAVEMDGPQRRYESVLITAEYLVDKMAPVDVVAKLPSSWFYDDATQG